MSDLIKKRWIFDDWVYKQPIATEVPLPDSFPFNLTGLTVHGWYEPSGSYMELSGSNIVTLYDKSFKNNHLRDVTVARRPVLVLTSSTWNGHNCMTFSSIRTLSCSNPTISGSSNLSIAVAYLPQTSLTRSIFNQNYNNQTFWFETNQLAVASGPGFLDSTRFVDTLGVKQNKLATFTPGTATTTLPNLYSSSLTQSMTINSNNSQNFTLIGDPLFFGSIANGGGAFQGSIAEAIIFVGIPTADQRLTISNYFQTKYFP